MPARICVCVRVYTHVRARMCAPAHPHTHVCVGACVHTCACSRGNARASVYADGHCMGAFCPRRWSRRTDDRCAGLRVCIFGCAYMCVMCAHVCDVCGADTCAGVRARAHVHADVVAPGHRRCCARRPCGVQDRRLCQNPHVHVHTCTHTHTCTHARTHALFGHCSVRPRAVLGAALVLCARQRPDEPHGVRALVKARADPNFELVGAVPPNTHATHVCAYT